MSSVRKSVSSKSSSRKARTRRMETSERVNRDESASDIGIGSVNNGKLPNARKRRSPNDAEVDALIAQVRANISAERAEVERPLSESEVEIILVEEEFKPKGSVLSRIKELPVHYSILFIYLFYFFFFIYLFLFIYFFLFFFFFAFYFMFFAFYILHFFCILFYIFCNFLFFPLNSLSLSLSLCVCVSLLF